MAQFGDPGPSYRGAGARRSVVTDTPHFATDCAHATPTCAAKHSGPPRHTQCCRRPAAPSVALPPQAPQVQPAERLAELLARIQTSIEAGERADAWELLQQASHDFTTAPEVWLTIMSLASYRRENIPGPIRAKMRQVESDSAITTALLKKFTAVVPSYGRDFFADWQVPEKVLPELCRLYMASENYRSIAYIFISRVLKMPRTPLCMCPAPAKISPRYRTRPVVANSGELRETRRLVPEAQSDAHRRRRNGTRKSDRYGRASALRVGRYS